MEKGTIIRLSYDMWLENVDGLFDTTDRDRASESGIYNPEHAYGPIVTVAGGERLVPGLEKAVLEQPGPGDWVEVELAAEDAYGPRDPKKIETVPMQRFKQSKVVPHVGERITYKNRPATVSRVAGGRVWVDTNSPLAGRTVKYRFKVDEVIEDVTAQLNALMEMDYRRSIPFEVSVEGKVAEVVVPDAVKYDQHWAIAKFRIAHDVGQYTSLDKVRFIEEYSTQHAMPPAPPAPAEAEEAEEAAQPAAAAAKQA